MTLLFNKVEDIDCGNDGETQDVKTVAYQIKDILYEEGYLFLLRWLIPQLLNSEDYGDEALILMEDVLKEN
mgnify:CR=1 FL=1